MWQNRGWRRTRMKDQITVVTGANRGLGLELCRQLKQALDPSARAWKGVIEALVLV